MMDAQRAGWHYLGELAKFNFAASPAGDRPDTYRNYECIATGTYPVTELSNLYRGIFGENMVYVQDLPAAVKNSPEAPDSRPELRIISVRHWRKRLRQVKLLSQVNGYQEQHE
jgi:hypothetical protein